MQSSWEDKRLETGQRREAAFEGEMSPLSGRCRGVLAEWAPAEQRLLNDIPAS